MTSKSRKDFLQQFMQTNKGLALFFFLLYL